MFLSLFCGEFDKFSVKKIDAFPMLWLFFLRKNCTKEISWHDMVARNRPVVHPPLTCHAHLQDHVVPVRVVADVAHVRDVVLVPEAVVPGFKVVITIFIEFSQFSATNGVFLVKQHIDPFGIY
jgi:hypothetical protein